MSKTVIYTSIFGRYDGLIPQTKLKGVDFVCFTDQDFKSGIWRVVKCTRKFEDNNRCAKEYKVLPHKFLSAYDRSIWIDGNFVVRKEPSRLFTQLDQSPMIAFRHGKDCIYDEYENINSLGKSTGTYKDDPAIMKAQIDRYRSEGYPAHFGLAQNNVLVREHNHPLVRQTMDLWWDEIRFGSRRDQLSLFYSIWRTGLSIKILPYDSRNSEWFYMLGKHRSTYKWKYFRYKVKSALGLLRKYKL
jgi:hypothetical protein